jgi:starch synthase (maltosyl-transferring)
MIAYSKRDEASRDLILAVVNLNPFAAQTGWLELDLAELGLPTDHAYRVLDLLAEQEFVWHGPRALITLDPAATPAHVLYIPR